MNRTWLKIVIGAALVAATLGVTLKAKAQYKNPADAPPMPEDNAVIERTTPYHHISAEGNFQTTWPSGCGRLRIRANAPEYFVGDDESDLIMVHVETCEQFGEPGEGCSVTATFDAKNESGGPAGPDQVLARVRNVLQAYGVKMTKQTPLKRVFPDSSTLEGVDVMGTDAEGKGQFWIRGLLSYHDIYILTAWSTTGNLWENPEYQMFFNGFLPFAEK
ncbi:MAG: hypothetical protein ACI9UK_000651 [Candidatus Krumholzibacteriia bacterium]|jgi:hypothetical protein